MATSSNHQSVTLFFKCQCDHNDASSRGLDGLKTAFLFKLSVSDFIP